MAVPVPSISCCIFNNNDFFYQEPNELFFNRDTCCHLVICLQLIASHYYKLGLNALITYRYLRYFPAGFNGWNCLSYSITTGVSVTKLFPLCLTLSQTCFCPGSFFSLVLCLRLGQECVVLLGSLCVALPENREYLLKVKDQYD